MHTLKIEAPRRRRLFRLWALLTALCVIAAAAWVFVSRTEDKHISAYFTSAVGIYPSSDVRVLGVQIGTVDSVRPTRGHVKVDMTIDGAVDIPAGATALVVTPSVVADRYVQLAPVYRGGPRIGDDAEIPIERTATPVELDELFSSLNDLTVALGPNGANRDGAVDELLRQGAKTLDGNGKALGESIRQLGDLARTVNDSGDDVFKTVDEISDFTAMLRADDDQVREATEQLASITGVLAEDRDDLGVALRELNEAVGEVQGFIHDNRGKFKSNLDKLVGITQILVDQKASLSEALDTAPNALTNVVSAYNPETGTLDARANLNEYRASDPALPLPSAGLMSRLGGDR